MTNKNKKIEPLGEQEIDPRMDFTSDAELDIADEDTVTSRIQKMRPSGVAVAAKRADKRTYKN